MEEAQIAGLIALYVVVELVKWFVPKSSLTTEEFRYLKELYDMHNHMDDSGRPLWYFPSDLKQSTEKIILSLEKIALVQNDSVNIAKSTIKILERMEIRANGRGK